MKTASCLLAAGSLLLCGCQTFDGSLAKEMARQMVRQKTGLKLKRQKQVVCNCNCSHNEEKEEVVDE